MISQSTGCPPRRRSQVERESGITRGRWVMRSVVLLVLLLAGCGRAGVTPQAKESAAHPAAMPRLKHVFLMVLENREYSPGGGPSYLRTLRHGGVLLSHSYGVTHPSLPNYLALLAGQTFGIHADLTGGRLPGPTLVDSLQTAHLSRAAYMEDAPSPCFRGISAGRYAIRHNPFAYFPSIMDNSGRCNRIRPFSRMYGDLHRSVPSFVWITPNLCNDG